METDLCITTLPLIGKRALRLGLACNHGLDPADIRWALRALGLEVEG